MQPGSDKQQQKLNPIFLWEFPTDFSDTIPSTFALQNSGTALIVHWDSFQFTQFLHLIPLCGETSVEF